MKVVQIPYSPLALNKIGTPSVVYERFLGVTSAHNSQHDTLPTPFLWHHPSHIVELLGLSGCDPC